MSYQILLKVCMAVKINGRKRHGKDCVLNNILQEKGVAEYVKRDEERV